MGIMRRAATHTLSRAHVVCSRAINFLSSALGIIVLCVHSTLAAVGPHPGPPPSLSVLGLCPCSSADLCITPADLESRQTESAAKYRCACPVGTHSATDPVK